MVILIATGMPGLYRLVTLYILNILFGIEVVGELSSSWALIQAVSMFTVVGWSALLFSRLPGLETKAQNDQFLLLLTSGLLTCIPCALILTLFWSLSLWTLVFFIVSWTTYGLIRQKLIATQEYNRVLVYDFLDLILTVFIIVLIYFKWMLILDVEYVIIIPITLLSIVEVVKAYCHSNRKMDWRPEFSGLIFGLSNFVSGGMAFLLIPLANAIAGKEVAGVYSLIITLVNIAYLLPRALSNFFTPKLSKAASLKCQSGKDVLRTFSRMNLYFIVCFVVSIVAFWPIIEKYYLQVEEGFFFLFLLAVLSTAAGQLNLPASRWLIVREKAKVSLVISTVTTSCFCMFVVFLYCVSALSEGFVGFLIVLGILLFIYCVRNVVQYFIVKSDFKTISKGKVG